MGQERGTGASGQPVPRHLTKLGLTGLPGQPAGGWRETSVVSCAGDGLWPPGRDGNVRDEEGQETPLLESTPSFLPASHAAW